MRNKLSNNIVHKGDIIYYKYKYPKSKNSCKGFLLFSEVDINLYTLIDISNGLKYFDCILYKRTNKDNNITKLSTTTIDFIKDSMLLSASFLVFYTDFYVLKEFKSDIIKEIDFKFPIIKKNNKFCIKAGSILKLVPFTNQIEDYYMLCLIKKEKKFSTKSFLTLISLSNGNKWTEPIKIEKNLIIRPNEEAPLYVPLSIIEKLNKEGNYRFDILERPDIKFIKFFHNLYKRNV